MHELAIADALVGIAAEHAGGRRVTRVDVKVGRLRQVVPSALSFGFELVAQGTVVEGAELTLEEVPVTGCCRVCGVDAALVDLPFACPSCGRPDVRIRTGEELLVESLEVTDEAEDEAEGEAEGDATDEAADEVTGAATDPVADRVPGGERDPR